MGKEENFGDKIRTAGFESHPENIDSSGRDKGSKNRSTIARSIMEMDIKIPEKILKKLKEIYPEMANNITIEEAMTYIQATKAIQDKDTAAYKALMDSGYGLANQHIDNNNETIIEYRNVSKQFPDEE